MSARMTSCAPVSALPGVGGLQAYGRQSRADMIAQFRAHHQRQLEAAQAALALSDDELIVTTFVGPHAKRHPQIVTDPIQTTP